MTGIIKMGLGFAAGYALARVIEANRLGLPLELAFRTDNLLRSPADVAREWGYINLDTAHGNDLYNSSKGIGVHANSGGVIDVTPA